MAAHWLHYGSETDPEHCAECGQQITPASILSAGVTILKASDATHLFRLPVYAGHWTIGGNWHVHVTKRPRWLTRVMMKWLLEWEWEELKVSAQEDE